MSLSVRVLFFASAREATGSDALILPCAVEGCHEAEFWDALVREWPALKALRHSARLAKNQEYLTPEDRIFPGDEVAVIPPVSGG